MSKDRLFKALETIAVMCSDEVMPHDPQTDEGQWALDQLGLISEEALKAMSEHLTGGDADE